MYQPNPIQFSPDETFKAKIKYKIMGHYVEQ